MNTNKPEPKETYRQKKIKKFIDKWFPVKEITILEPRMKTGDCQAVKEARAVTEKHLEFHRQMMKGNRGSNG